MTPTDLRKIQKLLGTDGARAGLIESHIQERQLIELATRLSITIGSKSSRAEIVEMLLRSVDKAPLKSTDELLSMSYDALISYFGEAAPSSEDLLKIMKELNYKVSAEDKKHLRRYVARQISETALFSQVATRRNATDDK